MADEIPELFDKHMKTLLVELVVKIMQKGAEKLIPGAAAIGVVLDVLDSIGDVCNTIKDIIKSIVSTIKDVADEPSRGAQLVARVIKSSVNKALVAMIRALANLVGAKEVPDKIAKLRTSLVADAIKFMVDKLLVLAKPLITKLAGRDSLTPAATGQTKNNKPFTLYVDKRTKKLYVSMSPEKKVVELAEANPDCSGLKGDGQKVDTRAASATAGNTTDTKDLVPKVTKAKKTLQGCTINSCSTGSESSSCFVAEETLHGDDDFVEKEFHIEDIGIGNGCLTLLENDPIAPSDDVSTRDPELHRVVHAKFQRPDGSQADIELLRDLSWIDDYGAAVGGTIILDMPEMGVVGPATVTAIKPCPPLKPGNGRLVTGTFRHTNAKVLDLNVEAEEKPIGVTPSHPFWSMDCHRWVPAGELRDGERLKTLDGGL